MNEGLFLYLYGFAHQGFLQDQLIYFFAQIFPIFVLIAAIYFLFSHHEVLRKKNTPGEYSRKKRELIYVCLAVFFAWLSVVLLKLYFALPRPFLELPNITPLFIPTDYSFPSGHAALFGALAVAIYLCHRRVGHLFMILALVIGLARVVAGVHYPYDILGGFLLGGLVSYLLIIFFRKL